MSNTPLETPLHAWHQAHKGRMVDFAGWSMPVQYQGIVSEHEAVRKRVGLFDISHMGRLIFEGVAAGKLLNHLISKDLQKIPEGRVRYGFVLNEEGGIHDDILVSCLKKDPENPKWLLVVNASNREKILGVLQQLQQTEAFQSATYTDQTHSWAMVALQGPKAEAMLQPLVDLDLKEIKYYRTAWAELEDEPVLLSRTGYTGENGFEIILSAEKAEWLWKLLMEKGEEFGIEACGLGARDTLRLEAGMPLYGHELSEDITPFAAGLASSVDLDVEVPFRGQRALQEKREQEPEQVRVGLLLQSKRAAREGDQVTMGAGAAFAPLGKVTSGSYSPTLETAIAMAYLPRKYQEPGTLLSVNLRGKTNIPAEVVKLPFYERQK
ncbi:Glycine cleavage system aminomethyltransferase GcvT [Planctomycetales bacterium 10988]|nr:Glycine cleavage system aminomethyltransferase GcvT [Planctomycetales bacterium 10988]